MFSLHNTRASKLTAELVADIRVKYHQEGWTQGRLARHFQVSIGQIGRIVRNESWQQFQMPASMRHKDTGAVGMDHLATEQEIEESYQRVMAAVQGSNTQPATPPTEAQGVGLEKLNELAEAEARAQRRMDEMLGRLKSE